MVDAAGGVLAEFGGVMLAFAFVATIGIQGLVFTIVLREMFGVVIFAGTACGRDTPGLIRPYSTSRCR